MPEQYSQQVAADKVFVLKHFPKACVDVQCLAEINWFSILNLGTADRGDHLISEEMAWHYAATAVQLDLIRRRDDPTWARLEEALAIIAEFIGDVEAVDIVNVREKLRINESDFEPGWPDLADTYDKAKSFMAVPQ